MAQQKTTFGATIISNQHNDTLQSLPALTPAVTQESINYPAHSPFYQHPPASHEQMPRSQMLSKSHLDINVLEKGFNHDELTPISIHEKNPFCSTVSVNANKECTMWPSHQTLVTTKMVDRKKKRSARFCACAGARHNWEQLHKNHRLSVRIVLALIIVAAMIGLGVGISKAVHGSYYSGGGNKST